MVAFSESWSPLLASNRLTSPRDAYRTIAYKFQFKPNTSNNYINGAVFNSFEEYFNGPSNQVEK